MSFLSISLPLVGLLHFLLVFNRHVERRDKGSDGKRILESLLPAKERMWCPNGQLLSFGDVLSLTLFGFRNGCRRGMRCLFIPISHLPSDWYPLFLFDMVIKKKKKSRIDIELLKHSIEFLLDDCYPLHFVMCHFTPFDQRIGNYMGLGSPIRSISGTNSKDQDRAARRQ